MITLPQLNIDDDYLNLMDDNGGEKNDVKLPDTDVGRDIKAAFEKSQNGSSDIRVTIISAMQEEQAISFKEVAVEK